MLFILFSFKNIEKCSVLITVPFCEHYSTFRINGPFTTLHMQPLSKNLTNEGQYKCPDLINHPPHRMRDNYWRIMSDQPRHMSGKYYGNECVEGELCQTHNKSYFVQVIGLKGISTGFLTKAAAAKKQITADLLISILLSASAFRPAWPQKRFGELMENLGQKDRRMDRKTRPNIELLRN